MGQEISKVQLKIAAHWSLAWTSHDHKHTTLFGFGLVTLVSIHYMREEWLQRIGSSEISGMDV